MSEALHDAIMLRQDSIEKEKLLSEKEKKYFQLSIENEKLNGKSSLREKMYHSLKRENTKLQLNVYQFELKGKNTLHTIYFVKQNY